MAKKKNTEEFNKKAKKLSANKKPASMKKQKSKKKKAEAKTMPYTTGWRCGTMSQRLRKYRGGFGGGNSW